MKHHLSVAILATLTLLAGCGGQFDSHETILCCNDFQDRLRVMTLNLAHGRGTSFHQGIVPPGRIRANLDRIADVTVEESVDVAGLQEADGRALWSGHFDHVAYLAEAGDFSWWVRGGHARFGSMRYGTGLVGNATVKEAEAIDFDTFGPGFHKGYTVSTVSLDGVEIDVVSVHLDPLLGIRRRKQVRQIVEHLQGRNRPRIVVGDFNVEWRDDGPIDMLAQELDLQVYRPEADDLPTFKKRRLDWILISADMLEFEEHFVVNRELSDHRAVIADIVLDGSPQKL